jgi:hypothetical protein
MDPKDGKPDISRHDWDRTTQHQCGFEELPTAEESTFLAWRFVRRENAREIVE